MTEELLETQETQDLKPIERVRFDGNDFLFYAGLILLGIGLAFYKSWPLALLVIGATLAATALINSYVRLFLSK